MQNAGLRSSKANLVPPLEAWSTCVPRDPTLCTLLSGARASLGVCGGRKEWPRLQVPALWVGLEPALSPALPWWRSWGGGQGGAPQRSPTEHSGFENKGSLLKCPRTF